MQVTACLIVLFPPIHGYPRVAAHNYLLQVNRDIITHVGRGQWKGSRDGIVIPDLAGLSAVMISIYSSFNIGSIIGTIALLTHYLNRSKRIVCTYDGPPEADRTVEEQEVLVSMTCVYREAVIIGDLPKQIH